MNKKILFKIFCSLLIICFLVCGFYKLYNYQQKRITLEKARIKALKFGFILEEYMGKVPVKDKQSAENFLYCVNVLYNARKSETIFPEGVYYYMEYICKEYSKGKLDYTIWIDTSKDDKHGYKHVITNQKPNVDLTKKLHM